jgi:hypothetical protein
LLPLTSAHIRLLPADFAATSAVTETSFSAVASSYCIVASQELQIASSRSAHSSSGLGLPAHADPKPSLPYNEGLVWCSSARLAANLVQFQSTARAKPQPEGEAAAQRAVLSYITAIGQKHSLEHGAVTCWHMPHHVS